MRRAFRGHGACPILGMVKSSKDQSSYDPSGSKRRMVMGIFFSCSSRFAIASGSVSPGCISTIGGAPMLNCNARVPNMRAERRLAEGQHMQWTLGNLLSQVIMPGEVDLKNDVVSQRRACEKHLPLSYFVNVRVVILSFGACTSPSPVASSSSKSGSSMASIPSFSSGMSLATSSR